MFVLRNLTWKVKKYQSKTWSIINAEKDHTGERGWHRRSTSQKSDETTTSEFKDQVQKSPSWTTSSPTEKEKKTLINMMQLTWGGVKEKTQTGSC